MYVVVSIHVSLPHPQLQSHEFGCVKVYSLLQQDAENIRLTGAKIILIYELYMINLYNTGKKFTRTNILSHQSLLLQGVILGDRVQCTV